MNIKIKELYIKIIKGNVEIKHEKLINGRICISLYYLGMIKILGEKRL